MTVNNNSTIGQPFIPASERGAWQNPYRPGKPARAASFYNRAYARQWVHRQLSTYQPDHPPLIWGRPGSGKTSFLLHLEQMPFTGYHFSMISAGALTTDNITELLWTTAQAGSQRLQDQGIHMAALSRRAFLLDPQEAFSHHFLQPVVAALQEKTWVLAIDDTHLLSDLTEHRPDDPTNLFAWWPTLEGTPPPFRLLLAARPGEPDPLHPAYAHLPAYTLPPLPREDAYALLQGPVPYPIYDAVAAYIYDLTGGYPAALQAVGHALFSRWQQGALSHVTTADALATARQAATFPAGSGRPDAEMPAAHWDPLPATTRPGRQWRRPLMVALSLLIILFAVLYIRSRREGATPVALPPAPATTNQTATGRPAATNRPAATGEGPAAAGESRPTTSPPASPSPSPAPPGNGVATTGPTAPARTPTPTLPASATPLPEQIVRGPDGMPMVLVPAGSFMMGEAGDRPEISEDETPAHPVTLDAFYLDRFEVSVAQYATYLNELAPADYQRSCPDLGCFFSRFSIGTTSFLLETELADGRRTYTPLAGFENYPVNHISWYGARDYCAAMGARLPTEAEWEYAARGADGRIYPWGNTPPDESRAVFASDSYANLKPVDALPAGASPFGIFGMAGGVWEWVADYYAVDYYAESPAENPAGPEEGPGRVTRGGGWPNNNRADRIRATNRNSLEPAYLSSDLGFRCARSVEN